MLKLHEHIYCCRCPGTQGHSSWEGSFCKPGCRAKRPGKKTAHGSSVHVHALRRRAGESVLGEESRDDEARALDFNRYSISPCAKILNCNKATVRSPDNAIIIVAKTRTVYFRRPARGG